MKKTVSPKTYQQVMEKYEWRCQHPGCWRRNVEYSHIIARSKDKSLIDHPGNGIPLCPEHHRTGRDSVHQSRWWKYYYYQFLTEDIKKKLSTWELLYCERNKP